MNPMMVSLALGYTSQQILDYLIKNSPRHAKSIQQALSQGYTADQISDFIMKEFEGKAYTKQAKRLEKSIESKASGSQRAQIAELREKRENKLGRILAGTGLAAAAGMGAAKILNRSPSPRQLQLPNYSEAGPTMPLPGSGPSQPQSPTGSAQKGPSWSRIMEAYQKHLSRGGKLSLNSFVKTAMGSVAGDLLGQQFEQNPSTSQIQEPQDLIDITNDIQDLSPTEPIAETQPSSPQQIMKGEEEMPSPEMTPQDAESILDQMKLTSRVDNLLQSNDPDIVKTAINFMLSSQQKKWLKDNQIDFDSVLDSYLNQAVNRENIVKSVKPDSENSSSQQNAPSEDIEESSPLEVGKPAVLPDGRVAKITKINEKGIVNLESEGKKLKAPQDQLLQPSEKTQKFSEDQIDAIINAIPESDRSTAFYTFQPLGDGLVMVEMTSDPSHVYLYENVPDDMSDLILSASVSPKTSGENLFGVYKKEVADSRGSPFHQLRSNPDKYPFKKIKKGYDLTQIFKKEATALNKKRVKERKNNEKVSKNRKKTN